MSRYQCMFCVCALSLFVCYVGAQEEDMTTETTKAPVTSAAEDIPFIETLLVGPFKVWHVAGFVACGIAVILIAICCMIDLRVPRTKEEIEANYEKRQAAHHYIDKLGKMEFTGLKLKSQALMQKEREKQKLERQEQKQKKDEEKKNGGKKQANKNQQPMNFPMGFPMMGGANPMMGGANPMMGGANPMMGGANPMMGGANPMMGGAMNNMMPFYPGVPMGNPAMYGSLTNISQTNPQTQSETMVPQGTLPRSQSMSQLKTVAEVERKPPNDEQTEEEMQSVNESIKSAKTPAKGRFSSLVKGLKQKSADSNAAKEQVEQDSLGVTKADDETLTAKTPPRKKWGKQ